MSPTLHEQWTAFRSAPGEDAFAPLYDASKNLVYTICYRIVRNEEDALDAFQAAYSRLLQVANDPDAADRVTDAGQLIRYLAVREADNLRKRRSRRLHREMTMDTLPYNAHDPNLTPDKVAANRQLREQVETLVSTLPERYRLPILLHYFHGMTHEEIATALGAPRSTITRRIGRALKKLQPIMRRAGLGEASASLSAIMAASALLSPPASWAASSVYTSASALASAAAAGSATAGAAGAATHAVDLVSGAAAASGKAAAGGLAAVKGWLAVGAAAVVIGGGVLVATIAPPGAATKTQGTEESKAISTASSSLAEADTSFTAEPISSNAGTASGDTSTLPASARDAARAPSDASASRSNGSTASTSSTAPDSPGSAATAPPSAADLAPFQIHVAWDKTREAVAATTVTATLINKARDDTTITSMTDEKGLAELRLPKSWDAIQVAVVGQPAALNPTRDVSLPAARQPYEIILERGASIYGHVYIQGTSKPAAGADVTIWGDWKRTKAAADGSYEIFGLAPGEIKIFSRHGALLSFLREDEIEPIPIVPGLRNGPHDIIVKPVLAVEGRVTDKATGQPIAGARVDAGLDFLASTTGADGRYRVDGLYAKAYTISAKAENYVAASSQYTMDDARPNVLDFALEPGASANVLVVDESGAPVPAARIYNDRGSVHDRKGETGEDGKIVVTGLSPTDAETGYLYAQKDGYQSSARIKPMFSQSTVTPSITLTLTREVHKPGAFTGRVTDESGDPIENATVHFAPAWRSSGEQGFKTLSNGSGEYRLDVTSKETQWRLIAFADGRAPAWNNTAAPGTAEQPAVVNFQLGPPHWLEITVLDEKKNPVSGVYVNIGLKEERYTQAYYIPGYERSQPTPPNGQLRFDNLPSGDVSLEVYGTGWTRYEEMVAVDEKVTVTLRSDGIIKGRVVDAVTNDPVTKFNIKIRGNYVDSNLYQNGNNINNSEGRFSIPNLHLIYDYSLIIEAEGYAIAISDNYAPAIADEAKDIIIQLREGKSLRGRLVETDGVTPIAGAPVIFGLTTQSRSSVTWEYLIRDGDNMQARQNTITNDEGRFIFNDIPDDGTIIVKNPGYARLFLEPSEQEPFKQDGELVIPLVRGAGIQGTYTLNGAPQAGINMQLSISSRIVNGRQRYESFERSLTDSLGRFDWKDLAAGSYAIHLYESRGRYSFGRFSIKVDVKAAEVTEINVGDHLGAFTLSGRVRMGEEPIEGAYLNLMPQFEWTVSRFTDHTMTNGEYRIFGLRPGKYLVDLYKTNEQGVVVIKHSDTITLSETMEKDFNLADRHRIIARLAFDDNVPASIRRQYKSVSIVRANATIEDLANEADQQLRPEGASSDYNGTGSIDEQGRLSIIGRFKGQYQMTLVLQSGGSRAASITIPQVITLDTLEADQDLGEIKVPATGAIQFTINSAGAIQSDNFVAILINESDAIESPQWGDPIMLDPAQKTQTISPVRAGSFRVGLFAMGYQVEPNLIPITIEPGQTATIEATVSPIGMIIGAAMSSQNNVTTMVHLSKITVKGPGVERTLTPMAGGMEDLVKTFVTGQDALFANQFIVQNLEDGEYDVTIEAQGYETINKTYEVKAGQINDVSDMLYMTKKN